MYIKRIKMSHIRGLPDVNLNLDRGDGVYEGLTVLAGPNGCGKTTFLQAIAAAFYGEHLGKQQAEQWCHIQSDNCSIRLHVEKQKCDFGSSNPHQVLATELGFKKSASNKHIWFQNSLELADIEETFDPAGGWFLVGYGPYRRLEGGSFDQNLQNQPRDRTATLFDPGTALPAGEEWLKNLNHQKLEGNEEAKTLESNVLSLLNDGFLPDDVVIERVTSKGIEVRVQGVTHTHQRLSDGCRSTLAMVTDLLRHMDKAFAGLQVEKAEHHLVVPHPGVLLIDELDAHMHISWQRRIGSWLKTRFPKLQIIVTTHSPFICQNADPKGLIGFKLQDPPTIAILDEEAYATVVNGSIDDAVISELFGLDYAHSPNAEKMMNRLTELDVKLARKTITPEERQERLQLMEEIPQIGTGDVRRLMRQLKETHS